MTLDQIQDELKGYHLEISLYPSGGMIEAVGCYECGTSEKISCSAIWKAGKGETIESAIVQLKAKIEEEIRG